MNGQQTLLYQVGSLLNGRFELLEVIGQGAMGVVYRALDRELFGQEVAVKVLYPHLVTRAEVVERFRNEVRIARELTHPHIVKIYEWGSDGKDRYFLVMEFVEGISLRSLLDGQADGRFPIGDSIKILYEIADAVAEAHRLGVVHRDLKPDNILVTTAGNIKVLDFGLARVLEDDRGLTRTGESLGTPYYMSPEQFRGEATVTQSDMYSFGIIAFEMLTGARPFEAEVYYQLALLHLNESLPEIPPELAVPDWLREIIVDATRKRPEQRTESMEQYAHALAAHLDQGTLRGYEELVRSWRATEHRRAMRLKRRAAAVRVRNTAFALMIAAGSYWVACMVNSRQWLFAGGAICWVDYHLSAWLAAPFKSIFRLGISETSVAGLEKEMRAFLENSRDPKIRDAEFMRRQSMRIEMLLMAGVPCAGKDQDGVPLLESFINNGPHQLMQQCFRNGASPNARTDKGTPLVHLAIRTLDNDLVHVFRTAAGFDPNIRDPEGNSLIHIAAAAGNFAVMDTLSSDRPEFYGLQNNEGDTPVHIVARMFHQMAPEYLVNIFNRRVDIYIKNLKGEQPLDLSIKLGHPMSVFLLLEHARRVGLTVERRDEIMRLAELRDDVRVTEVVNTVLSTPNGAETFPPPEWARY